MLALIDCNNFFVSCERLFRPDLLKKPVAVLSSNDGCAISRSDEVKALGIPMAGPMHNYRVVVEKYGIVSCSANFELYGDISRRLRTLLTTVTPALEIYSIDEAFLDLAKLRIQNYEEWGRVIRDRIAQEIGVPVSVGIAPTKTLAKLANHKAKELPELSGVLHLTNANTTKYLKSTPVRAVWGVGRKLAPKLLVEGVVTAYDLAHMRPKHAQQLLGIHGRIMASELLGTRCLQLQQTHKPQKMIARGRQFGADTNEWDVVESAVASMTARACLQLRREGQLTTKAFAVMRTNWRKPGYTTTVAAVDLREPTADTGVVCQQLIASLAQKFNTRLSYHKADVFLANFVQPNSIQLDLFGQIKPSAMATQARRMHAIDSLNATHQPQSVQYAAEKLSDAWTPRKNHASPRYTSQWSDIPEAFLS
ncbi:MAG: Y-family polymerase [Patescibacteria group bacterium]|nr:Y-family DNA polymerase [Candidatus Saccharibacteria bacterium]MDQ5963209.1 Y-family polymerase [Patescibacteria group bacterium]